MSVANQCSKHINKNMENAFANKDPRNCIQHFNSLRCFWSNHGNDCTWCKILRHFQERYNVIHTNLHSSCVYSACFEIEYFIFMQPVQRLWSTMLQLKGKVLHQKNGCDLIFQAMHKRRTTNVYKSCTYEVPPHTSVQSGHLQTMLKMLEENIAITM